VEESKVFSLFQISLQNYYDLRAALLKYSHLQPSEMDRLPFFELEELLDSLKDLAEKEEEERKKKEGKERGSMPNFNVNSMMSRMNSGSGLPTPSMPNLKM
jgi:hypothetical protein